VKEVATVEQRKTQRQAIMDWVGLGWLSLSVLYLVAFPAALFLALT
jgi:hypothetical protein